MIYANNNTLVTLGSYLSYSLTAVSTDPASGFVLHYWGGLNNGPGACGSTNDRETFIYFTCGPGLVSR